MLKGFKYFFNDIGNPAAQRLLPFSRCCFRTSAAPASATALYCNSDSILHTSCKQCEKAAAAAAPLLQ